MTTSTTFIFNSLRISIVVLALKTKIDNLFVTFLTLSMLTKDSNFKSKFYPVWSFSLQLLHWVSELSVNKNSHKIWFTSKICFKFNTVKLLLFKIFPSSITGTCEIKIMRMHTFVKNWHLLKGIIFFNWHDDITLFSWPLVAWHCLIWNSLSWLTSIILTPFLNGLSAASFCLIQKIYIFDTRCDCNCPNDLWFVYNLLLVCNFVCSSRI